MSRKLHTSVLVLLGEVEIPDESDPALPDREEIAFDCEERPVHAQPFLNVVVAAPEAACRSHGFHSPVPEPKRSRFLSLCRLLN